jgi:hypothetical protein
MKKYFIIILCIFLLFAVSDCTANTDKQAPQNSGSNTPAQTETSKPAASSKPSQQAAAIIEPSALISRQEAEDILGKQLGEGKNKEQQVVGLKLCVYESEDNDMLQVGLTQQAFMEEGNSNTPESMYKSILKAFPDAQKAEGVGDEAYFATPGIHIMKSGYYISVSIGLLKVENKEDKLIEAGKLAVANLETALGKQ